MFRITNILNPLTGGSTTEEYAWESGKPLAEYLEYAGEAIVACNGEMLAEALDAIFPARKEEYTVVMVPEGGDRTMWRNVANIALAGALFATPAGWAGVAGKAWLGFVGGNAIRLFLRDKEPQDRSQSASYAWHYQSSPNAAQGKPMPIVYGKVRVRPTLKNRYIKIEGDKQYLYALYGLAAHRVDERDLPTDDDLDSLEYGAEYTLADGSMPGVTFLNEGETPYGHGTASFAEDIIINGRAIGDFGAEVQWETRPGLPEQMVILGFEAAYATYTQDLAVYMDVAEVNPKELQLSLGFINPSRPKFIWHTHTLLIRGTAYTIPANNAEYTIGKVNYLYLDTAVSEADYQVQHTTAPSGSTKHIVATHNTAYAKSPFLANDMACPETADWVYPVTEITNAHNLEVVFELPYGLYGQKPEGGLRSAACRLFAQYRLHGADTWTDFEDYPASIPRSGNFVPDPDVRRNDRYSGLPTHGTDIDNRTIIRATTQPFALSLRALPDDYPLGLLDPEESYDIRVSASSPCVVKLVSVMGIVFGSDNSDGDWPGFTYPGEPLLGIKALASSQINSDLDVQVDVERSDVWVYNSNKKEWVTGDATNYAWAVYDILANGHPDHPAYPDYGNDDADAIYGCGVDHRRLDYRSFKVWAEHIGYEGSRDVDSTTLGYTVNIVYDTFMSAWDAILRLCQEGHGMVYPIGTTIYAFADMAASVSQVFTIGNIHLDTFVQQYLDRKNRMSMIEAAYWDADRNYERTTIAVRTADWDTGTDLNSPTAITLYGTNSFDQAVSITQYLLTSNLLLDNMVSFGVDVEAIGVKAGDVVEVQHDILTSGQGGRIVSVTDVAGVITVVVDRTLTMVAGTQYTFTVYHGNGTREVQNGYTSPTSSNTLVFDPAIGWSWDTTPAAYEVYAFGEAAFATKQYRVTKIGRTNELMRTLTLVQYDAALYEAFAPGDDPPGDAYGQYVSSKIAISNESTEELANLLNFASNVQLREILSRNRVTGEYESSIQVSWDTVQGDPRGSWEVYFRDVDVSDVDWQGAWETVSDGYSFRDKVEHDGKTYISLGDANTTTPGS